MTSTTIIKLNNKTTSAHPIPTLVATPMAIVMVTITLDLLPLLLHTMMRKRKRKKTKRSALVITAQSQATTTLPKTMLMMATTWEMMAWTT